MLLLPHIRVATYSIFPGFRFPRRLGLGFPGGCCFFSADGFYRLLHPIPEDCPDSVPVPSPVKATWACRGRPWPCDRQAGCQLGRPFLRRAPNLMPHKPGVGGTLLPRLKMATAPASHTASQRARELARDHAGGLPWPEAPGLISGRRPAGGGAPASSRRGQSACGAG